MDIRIRVTKKTLYDKLPPEFVPVAKSPEFGLRLDRTLSAVSKEGPNMPRDLRLHLSTPAGDHWHAHVTGQHHRAREREALEGLSPAGELVVVSIPVPRGLDTDALVEGVLAVLSPPAHLFMRVGRAVLGALGAAIAQPQQDGPWIRVTADGTEQLTAWTLVDMELSTTAEG